MIRVLSVDDHNKSRERKIYIYTLRAFCAILQERVTCIWGRFLC